MAREFVNEGSACTVRARFSNLGVLTAPASIRYRIKDVTNDRIVTDWTDVPAASSIEIEVTAEENAIYNDSSQAFRLWEHRVLVVQANYDTDNQFANEIPYMIRNLRGFNS